MKNACTKVKKKTKNRS